MIPNQWYAVLNSKEVKKGKVIGAKRFGEKLAFWKDKDGNVSCIKDKCCHRGASLSLGKVVDEHLQCPFHGLEYDSTGKVVVIPANGKEAKVPKNFKVNAYPTRDKFGFIWVWFGDFQEDLPAIKFFDIDKKFSYSSFSDHWTVHYTRAIENQLDVSHLPFVHSNSIGRGNKTLVNGPKVEVEDNMIRVWVNNEKDKGQKPLKPDEFPEDIKETELQFRFPNIWQNRLSEKLRIVAAFVPIDEKNTRIYIRFYQKFIRVPGFRRLINSISDIGNKWILGQDKKVVLTQRPIKTELEMGENLFQADLPIITFRRIREKLKSSNSTK
ncbi:MAG: Rieske 2Fe-2S domain-containing protein [Candidatus Lokiarchaeota archaeon]|nr:Rieske 2Fe-2S domain-containing protein [Candidatus Lokiarchaeota archaeon]